MEVLIEPAELAFKQMGIDESSWKDDLDSIADWDAWIKSIEPLEFTNEKVQRISHFEQQMRQYNLDAVSLQMREWHGE
jgi:hypothetical protein